MKRSLDDLAGIVIKDKYKLESLVGEGGMAYVYRGVHMDFEHPIAFKVLFSNFASKPDVRERFKREATLQFRLQHPNIVRVIDMIEEDNLLGIVLDWVEGSDLEVYLKNLNRPASLMEVRRLFMPILQAVGYAHDQQIVHRDLKPSNVLLSGGTGREVPRVMDFGIAKSLSDNNFKTRTGLMVGTPYYISPEQAQGMRSVDHRTDIYSLGVTLFQMLTGRVPFEGKNALEVVAKHCFSEVPILSNLRTDLDPIFGKVVQQAMAKDPAERFRSARAFARALDGLLPAYEESIVSQDELFVGIPLLDSTAFGDPPVPSGWKSPASTQVLKAEKTSLEGALLQGLPSAADVLNSEFVPEHTDIGSPSHLDAVPVEEPLQPAAPSSVEVFEAPTQYQTGSGETFVGFTQPPAISTPGVFVPLPTGEGWRQEEPNPSLESKTVVARSAESDFHVTPPYPRPLPVVSPPPKESLFSGRLEAEANSLEVSTPYLKPDATVFETQPDPPSTRPAFGIWMFLAVGLVSGVLIFALLSWLQRDTQTQPSLSLRKKPLAVDARKPTKPPASKLSQGLPVMTAATPRTAVTPRTLPSRPAAKRRVKRTRPSLRRRRVKRRRQVRRRRRVKRRRRAKRRRRLYAGRMPKRSAEASWKACRVCIYKRWEKVRDVALMEQREASCNRGDVLEMGSACARACGYYYVNFCTALMIQSSRKCKVWLSSMSLLQSRSLRYYRRTASPAVIQRCMNK